MDSIWPFPKLDFLWSFKQIQIIFFNLITLSRVFLLVLSEHGGKIWAWVQRVFRVSSLWSGLNMLPLGLNSDIDQVQNLGVWVIWKCSSSVFKTAFLASEHIQDDSLQPRSPEVTSNWFPVNYRGNFKAIIIVCTLINGLSPDYIKGMLILAWWCCEIYA